MKRFVILVAVALAGCGSVAELHPAAGEKMPVTAYGTGTVLTAGQLMAPTTQQRPRRSDEVLTQSEERRDDAFDLPPP